MQDSEGNSLVPLPPVGFQWLLSRSYWNIPPFFQVEVTMVPVALDPKARVCHFILTRLVNGKEKFGKLITILAFLWVLYLLLVMILEWSGVFIWAREASQLNSWLSIYIYCTNCIFTCSQEKCWQWGKNACFIFQPGQFSFSIFDKTNRYPLGSKFSTTDSVKPPLLANLLKLSLVLPPAKTSRRFFYFSSLEALTECKLVHINT